MRFGLLRNDGGIFSLHPLETSDVAYFVSAENE